MKGLDTNILVRFLVGDHTLQAKKVYNLFKMAERKKIELFVPLPVVLELIWVLESAYKIKRNDIIDSINELLLLPILKFEHRPAIQLFAQAAQNNNFDLSDLLIAFCAKEEKCETVLTFDKKASKFSLFELLK